MTEEELAALVAILNKTTVSPAERLWVVGFVEKLRGFIETPQEAKAE
jgi:hypothetical protein